MRILDRYIFREMLPPFFLTTAVLLFVLVLQRLFRLADLVVSKGATLAQTAQVLLYVLPGFLVITLPMSLLVASLTAFSRLSADSEVTAMKASRVSLYRMVRPVFLFGLLVFSVTAFTSLVLVPGSNTALKAHLFDMVRTRLMVGLEPGVFSSAFDGMVIYVDKTDASDNLEGVFISDERSAREPYAIVAKRGKLTADPKTMNVTLAMEDGSIHARPGEDQSYSLMGFSAARLYLDMNASLAKKGAPDRGYADMSSAELLEDIGKAREQGKPTFSQESELHKRLSIPFACVIFGLISAPLGIRRHRTGKSVGIVISLLVFLVYYIILGSAANLAETGTLSPLLAYWIPNCAMAAAAALFVLIKGREINFLIWDTVVAAAYGAKQRVALALRRGKLS
jgi:lipopolysaccharide export system permease protein